MVLAIEAGQTETVDKNDPRFLPASQILTFFLPNIISVYLNLLSDLIVLPDFVQRYPHLIDKKVEDTIEIIHIVLSDSKCHLSHCVINLPLPSICDHINVGPPLHHV